MARGIGGIGHTLLSLSVLAALTGCGGGAGVTQNALSSGSSGSSGSTGSSGGNANPGPTTPSTGGGTGTTTPPPVNEAIGDPAVATANNAVLTTTQTNVYNLNTVALGSSGWRPTARLENNNTADATSPHVAFDAAGNGFAVWALGSDIFLSRYTASTASWSSPVALDNGIDEAHQPRVAVDRATGNATVSFTQSDGVAESMYATRFTASTNSWSTPVLLENTNGAVVAGPESNNVSVAGSQAAVAWRQNDGTAISIYLSRFVNDSWTVPQLVDATALEALHPEVATDSSGNVTVAWRQRDNASGGEFRIHSRRWNNTTQTFEAIQLMDNEGDRQGRLQFDAQGNGFLLWRGGGAYARHYDKATNTWGPEVRIHNSADNAAWDAELSVDPAGNAMAVWVETDGTANSLWARRYDVLTGTWGSSTLLENMSTPTSLDHDPTVSLSGNEAVVAWVQDDADGGNVYGIKMNNGVWGAVTLLETREEQGLDLASTINAAGNAAVLLLQADGYAESIWQARYLTANFVVPAGATWQSIANSLYGVNNVEAGTALQTAMGGGALTEGAILSGFPSTLSVTTSIPPYYTVLATDTWSHIAARVYGVTDVAAITQLQTLLGNPTLSTGLHLVVPTTVSYTESANFRAPLDWTRVNTTTTTYHSLNTGVLTTPLNDWSAAGLLENTSANHAAGARVAFDSAGNGIAVWTQGNDVFARRFTVSNGQWGTAVVLDSNTNTAASPRVVVDPTTSDAIVTWAQSDGVASSLYVSNYNASTNTWSVAALLENTNGAVSQSLENSSLSLAGSHAAIAWLQSDGTVDNVYLSRRVAGTWTAPQLVDDYTQPGLHPEVAIDHSGNATVVWRQREAGGDFRINSRRWNNTTQSFGAVLPLDGDGDRQPRIGFDSQGNGIALWRGDGVYARHYDVATDTWDAQVQISAGPGGAYNGELAVDTNGDALATWVESDGTVNSAYARHYDAATRTWGARVVLENLSTPADIDNNPTVSLVNGSGVVAWVHDNAHHDLYAARFSNGTWGSAVLLETREENAADVFSHIDGHSNATVLWIQGDGGARSVYAARSNGTPYYSVPAGATWQSLANTLYGVNSAEAATALATAAGNPTLTTGLHLSGLPATLAVSPTVPTHYLVQSGDTWASITLALYGTSRTEAATALWDYLGRPTLTVNAQLLIPAELSYTIVE